MQKRPLLVDIGVGSRQPHFPLPGGRCVEAPPLAVLMGLGLGGGESFTVFVSESENVSFPMVLTN